MKRLHGPSKSVLPQKQQQIKELFGTDSEEEESANKKEALRKKVRERYEDILEITIDNEDFVSPNKVNHITQTPVSISPQPKTPVRTSSTHIFKTPTKQTYTNKESLTPEVKRIFSRTIQVIEPLSPLSKTPIRKIHEHQHNIHTSIQPKHTHTHNTNIHLSARSATNSKDTNASSSIARAPHARTFKEQQSIVSNNRTRFQPHAHVTNTRKRNKAKTVNSRSQSFAQKKRTQANTSRSLTATSQTRTLTQIKTSTSRSHTAKSHTLTHTQAKKIASNSTFIRAQTHKQINHSTFASKTAGRQTTTNDAHTLTQVNTITPESITVTISNTAHTSTNTENQTVVKEPQVVNKNSNSNLVPPNTRIITLGNKNVPEGVHLAIAIDKNKFLSKNALKKITRNLLSQI